MKKISLCLSPYAYCKLMWLNERTKNEVGCLGITDLDSPLYVKDIIVPKQKVSMSSTEFDDDGVNDLAANLCKQGLQMNQFLRIWIHTHPQGVAGPSGTDETTFKTNFGKSDWAVMLILPKNGQFYCRLRTQIGQSKHYMESEVPVEVDWAEAGPMHDAWDKEFTENVSEFAYAKNTYNGAYGLWDEYNYDWNPDQPMKENRFFLCNPPKSAEQTKKANKKAEEKIEKTIKEAKPAKPAEDKIESSDIKSTESKQLEYVENHQLDYQVYLLRCMYSSGDIDGDQFNHCIGLLQSQGLDSLPQEVVGLMMYYDTQGATI